MIRKLHSSIVATAFCLAVCASLASESRGATFAPVKASQVTIPIYAEGESNAVAVLRAERVAREQCRLGFFRVKLLPLLVVEKARLELQPAGLRCNPLARVQAGLEPLTGKVPFEFREFQVFFPDERTARLSARSVHPASSGSAWALDDVTLYSDQGPITLAHARLLFDGEESRLVWPTNGATAQFNLFPAVNTTNQFALIKVSR